MEITCRVYRPRRARDTPLFRLVEQHLEKFLRVYEQRFAKAHGSLRLGRDVAIKVLPAEVGGDAERLARFRREAHVLASLNHPSIAAIYGLEEADGKPFLVLELVEGETLQERAVRGRIPVDEALKIARQVAEALEEAHEHGIVHRDLKPANVELTAEGKVKVLDFGLAKAYGGDAGDTPEVSHSPTLTRMGTEAGVILGTAAYMSPEQARGKRVDKRADIWAFGVLLYEMLAGRSLFSGDTVSDVLASVLRQEIDWKAPPPALPAELRLLARCLERDPKNRPHDIADARIAIDDLLGGANRDEPPIAAAPKLQFWRPCWTRRSPSRLPAAQRGAPAHRRPAHTRGGGARRLDGARAGDGMGAPRGRRGGLSADPRRRGGERASVLRDAQRHVRHLRRSGPMVRTGRPIHGIGFGWPTPGELEEGLANISTSLRAARS